MKRWFSDMMLDGKHKHRLLEAGMHRGRDTESTTKRTVEKQAGMQYEARQAAGGTTAVGRRDTDKDGDCLLYTSPSPRD
eukprot:4184268-Alexandrium_andersonii.AAC.1